MNDGGKYLLLILLGAAMLANTACTTTTQRAGPSQAAMRQHGISEGDTVLVRYTNIGDANSSSRSELLQITGISNSGIAGVDENGEASVARYGEIFQIERQRTGLRRPGRTEPSPQLVNAMTKTGRVLGTVIYGYFLALGGG
jgi:hypothetical protein